LDDYVKGVEKRLQEIFIEHAEAKLTNAEALAEVVRLQEGLREGLRSGEIALQAADLEMLKTGALTIVGLGVTIVSTEALEARETELFEEASAAYSNRERQKNAYVKYLTAGQYTGHGGFVGFLGSAVDFFNPVQDVIDITDILEDIGRWAFNAPADEE
jgi:hypothetical protein